MSRSAERALQLLDSVASRGSLTLSEAAQATDVPSSTTLRHLRALVHYGYLVRDDLGLYSVGPSFLRIALAAFRSGPYARLTAAAQPHLDQLAATTEESAYLAVRDGVDAVYIATAESPRAIRHVGWVGSSVPIDGTAVGRALSASLVGGDRPKPEFKTGGIEPDVTAVSVPVVGTAGVFAALSLLGPTDRFVDARLEVAAESLIDAAVAIGSSLSDSTGVEM